MALRKYLSIISLLLFTLFIIFAYITPIEVNGTSEIGDIVVISLIIASFLTAFFSQKGKLRIFALIVSAIPVLFLLGLIVLPIFYLLEQ
ncbi:histidine kinase [Lysinibacillus sp. CNPSo 3705]|uniref:histidine kinase n=1 Tax=Lysinibacillus sp. CNPSo 3705 TaxID=3028148 RepID=UPI0010499A2B|nr:histidine kinase [Lysinibacillus sp. CNPSo 3705]MDD1504805.1 histidine kinase [Lysinibacillus sp. CNPSo 3705]